MQRIDSLNLIKPGHVIGRRRVTPADGTPAYSPESSIVVVVEAGRPTAVLIHTDQEWN